MHCKGIAFTEYLEAESRWPEDIQHYQCTVQQTVSTMQNIKCILCTVHTCPVQRALQHKIICNTLHTKLPLVPFEEEKHLSGRPTYKTHPQNIYNPPGHHIYPTTTLYNPPGYPCIHVDIPHYLTFVMDICYACFYCNAFQFSILLNDGCFQPCQKYKANFFYKLVNRN